MPKRNAVCPPNGFGEFWRRNATTGVSSTPVLGGPLIWSDSAEAGPQLLTLSHARTHSFCAPMSNGFVSSAPVTSTVVVPNAPVIAVPLPAGAGELPNDHSAAGTCLLYTSDAAD